MTLHRIALVCTLTLVGSTACGGDPGKNVNTAESELSGDQQKASTEQQDANAEATSKEETAHAEAAADKNAATSDAKTNVAVSKADLEQDRRDFDSKTKERLAKIDAKAKELSTKSAKLTGKKATDFKTQQTSYTTLRNDANAKVSGLASATNDGWSAAKADVVKSLDDLDSALAGMGKDL